MRHPGRRAGRSVGRRPCEVRLGNGQTVRRAGGGRHFRPPDSGGVWSGSYLRRTRFSRLPSCFWAWPVAWPAVLTWQGKHSPRHARWPRRAEKSWSSPGPDFTWVCSLSTEGRQDEAVETLRGVLADHRSVGDVGAMSIAVELLAWAAMDMGDDLRAAELMGVSNGLTVAVAQLAGLEGLRSLHDAQGR